MVSILRTYLCPDDEYVIALDGEFFVEDLADGVDTAIAVGAGAVGLAEPLHEAFTPEHGVSKIGGFPVIVTAHGNASLVREVTEKEIRNLKIGILNWKKLFIHNSRIIMPSAICRLHLLYTNEYLKDQR